jgi:ABC-2 type transport system ATP-binding protein
MRDITLSTSEDDSLRRFNIDAEDTVIQVEGLYKRYGKLVALKGINFTVKRGEIFGLIGPDGAGKTTTFHILSGIMQASDGKIQIFGKSPIEKDLSKGLSISYLTQQFSLDLDLSVEENLRYTAKVRGVPDKLFHQRRLQYLRLMNLEKFEQHLAGRLSGGMKQKLALCCALISQPEILLLDEPTTGVDPVSRREFWDILTTVANQGVTIVVATPYLDEAERCHRIALMHEGSIQQIGTLAQLRESLNLQRLSIFSENIQASERILTNQRNKVAQINKTSIVDVQTFGDRLDVLVEDASIGINEIRTLFRQHNLKLNSIYTGDLTLENIFVTRLRDCFRESEFVAFPHGTNLKKRSDSDIAIGANKLQKVFGNFQAVKSVNLEVRYGEIYGLLGANGAGKTTTIRMLCGLLEATSGKISLAGQTRNLRSSLIRQKIGYMSQKFTLYDDLSIIQNLEFYCGIYKVTGKLRKAKIDWVVATSGLQGKENMLVGKLPGGWKQRVAFAASVMHEPEILFLDEPSSGVDPLARRNFWRLINEFARQGTAVLVTTHYLEEAEQCNRVGFMVGGELVIQGSPSDIKASQPGQLLEIIAEDNQQASHLLKSKFGNWRVSIFGDCLHLVLDDVELDISYIRSYLVSFGSKVRSIRYIPFSLENAFINTVRRTQSNFN